MLGSDDWRAQRVPWLAGEHSVHFSLSSCHSSSPLSLHLCPPLSRPNICPSHGGALSPALLSSASPPHPHVLLNYPSSHHLPNTWREGEMGRQVSTVQV